MASLLWPIGTRPIAALPRRSTSIVPTFAVLAAAGTGAFTPAGKSISSASMASAGAGVLSTTITAKSSAVFSSSGVGAFSVTMRGNASAVLATGGLGAFSAPSSVKSFMALTSAGVGSFSPKLSSLANSSLSCAGVAAFAPVMRASISSATQMIGSSSFGATDSPSSVATFAGRGALAAVSYAFYLDAERAIPDQELRVAIAEPEYRILSIEFDPNRDAPIEVASIQPENRTAIISFEDRVYQVGAEQRWPPIPNRKRK